MKSGDGRSRITPMGVLRSPDGTWAEKDAAFHALLSNIKTAEVEVEHQGIHSLIRMNLMIAQPELNLGQDDLERVAIECTKRLHVQEAEFHWRLASLCGSDRARSESWFQHALRVSCGSPRNGLIIGTIRFGMCRHLVVERFLQGHSAYQIVNDDYFHAMKPVFAKVAERYRIRSGQRFDVINADAPGSGMEMVRALSGSTICVAMDGTSGGSCGVEIDFLGRRVRVKSGMLEIARKVGAKILPVIGVSMARDSNVFRYGECLDRCGVMSPTDIAQKIYSFFEESIRQNPGQWEGVSNFHNLASGGMAMARGSENVTCTPDLVKAVAEGLVLECPANRYAIVVGRQVSCCVDTKTLRAVSIEKGMELVTRTLLGEARVSSTKTLLERLDSGSRERGAVWLAQLVAYGIARHVPS